MNAIAQSRDPRVDAFPFAENAEDALQTYTEEQAVLAACLARTDLWAIARGEIGPEHFSDAFHGRIFERMGQIADAGHQINVMSLFVKMAGDLALGEGVEGQKLVRAYITDLARSCAGYIPSMVQGWCREIAAQAMKRRIRATANTLAQDPSSLDRPLADILAEFSYISQTAPTTKAGAVSVADAAGSAITQIEAAYKNGSRLIGVPTGFVDLDAILGGLAPSDLTILGGRPSMGKTGLALNIGVNAAKSFNRTLFFSQEMSKEQLSLRVLAGMTGIGSDDMRRGAVDEDEFNRIMRAREAMSLWQLNIDDAAALRVSEMRRTAERVKSSAGLDLIIVDYLQLCRPDRDRESRTVDITDVSAALKSMAKSLNVPVLALAQLSRGVEQRDDKRPQLADLRDSGAIEQDADQVIFIYREEYYLQRTEPDENDPKREGWEKKIERCRGIAEAIVAKNRHGRIGTAKLTFDARRQLFSNHYAGPDNG